MADNMLKHIKDPSMLKVLSTEELKTLCEDIRAELINTVSSTGGHLASNLGVVELTVALHKMFNTPADSILFDVGHQCYTHKLLTGRLEKFPTLRQEGGLSGFPRPSESFHDPMICGHSSTSVSSALGIAKANTLAGNGNYAVAVVGDGALGGGMVYEAINNAGRAKDRLIIILNDNKMSISKNVGGMARHLAVIRSRMSYFRFKSAIDKAVSSIPAIGPKLRNWLFRSKSLLKNAIYKSTIFEDMGIAYLGPIDGHDIEALIRNINVAKAMKRPVLIHIHTIKGKGYSFAEKNPKDYHGVPSFDIETGDYGVSKNSFSYIFGEHLSRLAEKDSKICAITAAMTEGTGLMQFRESFKNRFFDVGIAEQHAFTFAAGMSKGGLLPVFAVYSSFLQRSYDQIVHDGAIQQDLKIILGIDRAGIVGEDGETHQGIMDTSFLTSIPNITVFAAADYDSLRLMLEAAIYKTRGVAAVRYPRGAAPKYPEGYNDFNTAYTLFGGGADNVIVTYGRISANAAFARDSLYSRGIKTDLLVLGQIHPIMPEVIQIISLYKNVFFFEEGIKTGGISEHCVAKLAEAGFKGSLSITAISDKFVPHASIPSILKQFGLDKDAMEQLVFEKLREN